MNAPKPIEDNVDPVDGVATTDRAATPAPDNKTRQQRRHARLSTPLKIRVNDKTYSALDWSLSGFRIGEIDELFLAGDKIHVAVIMPFGEFEFSFGTTAAVRWVDLETRQAGCEFLDLTANQKSTLGYFVASFIKGKTLTVEDAVQSVKPGVDDVSVTSDGEVTYRTKWHQLRATRRLMTQIGVAAAALLLVLLLMRTVLLSTFSFASTAAWVDVPPVELHAPTSGRMVSLTIQPGNRIQQGAPIAYFHDAFLEQELDIARAELSRLRFAYATVEEDASEREVVLSQQLELAEINLEAATARLHAAENAAVTRYDEWSRVNALHERGVASAAHLQEAMRLRIQAEAGRDVARAERRAAESQVEIAQNGYFVGTSRIAGDDPEFLSRTAADISQEIVVQETRVATLERRIANLIVESPCNCVVDEVPYRESQWITTGQTIAVLREVRETAQIVAYVTHREAAALAQGQSVAVRLSDGSVDEGARIAAIDTRPTPTNTRILSSRGHEPSLLAEVTIELTEDLNTFTRSPVEVAFVQKPVLWLERMLYLDF